MTEMKDKNIINGGRMEKKKNKYKNIQLTRTDYKGKLYNTFW